MKCPVCVELVKKEGIFCSEAYYFCKNCDKYFQIEDITEEINKI